MASFFYKVKNQNGKIEKGYITASSVTGAANKLEEKKYIVLEIREEEEIINYNYSPSIPLYELSKSTVFSVQENKEFFTSFYFLYKSGYSILQTFDSMYNSSKNPKIKALCFHLLDGIEKGFSLEDTMKKYSNSLSLAYLMLVVAGEKSGQLDDILSSIIANITMQEKVKTDIISKMTYPVSMFFLAIFVAMLFKFFIIEIFNSSAAGNTPCLTSIGISAIMKMGLIFLIIGGIIFALYKSKKTLISMFPSIFSFGPIANMIKNYTYSNFFSVLALAYKAGITTADSLNLAKTVIGSANIRSKLNKAFLRVQQGCELTTALRATSLFSDYAISQVSAGEKAGELDKMLKAVAYDYEVRLKTTLGALLKLVEPLMIVFVGLVVLYVALSGYKAYYGYLFSLI